VMWVVLHRSVYGRHLFATGRNEIAARYSGINAHRVIVSAYVILGCLTGISAIIFAFYTNSISPSSHGSFFELFRDKSMNARTEGPKGNARTRM